MHKDIHRGGCKYDIPGCVADINLRASYCARSGSNSKQTRPPTSTTLVLNLNLKATPNPVLTNGNGAIFGNGAKNRPNFFSKEKRVDVGKRPSVSYTAPLLEVVGGIESSAKGLFVGARALAKLSRLAAFFSAGNQRLARQLYNDSRCHTSGFGMERKQEEKQELGQEFKYRLDTDQEWGCAECTFVNPGPALACQVCHCPNERATCRCEYRDTSASYVCAICWTPNIRQPDPEAQVNTWSPMKAKKQAQVDKRQVAKKCIKSSPPQNKAKKLGKSPSPPKSKQQVKFANDNEVAKKCIKSSPPQNKAKKLGKSPSPPKSKLQVKFANYNEPSYARITENLAWKRRAKYSESEAKAARARVIAAEAPYQRWLVWGDEGQQAQC
eukprot:g55169.t1